MTLKFFISVNYVTVNILKFQNIILIENLKLIKIYYYKIKKVLTIIFLNYYLNKCLNKMSTISTKKQLKLFLKICFNKFLYNFTATKMK